MSLGRQYDDRALRVVKESARDAPESQPTDAAMRARAQHQQVQVARGGDQFRCLGAPEDMSLRFDAEYCLLLCRREPDVVMLPGHPSVALARIDPPLYGALAPRTSGVP